MRLAFALPMMLVLACTLLSCGRSNTSATSGEPPTAPSTESVEPVADREGSLVCNVSFTSALVPDSYAYSYVAPSSSILGTVGSYSWNFGGGAFPNTSTLVTPMVKLLAAGTYSGSLTVTDLCGLPRTRTFTYIVYPYLYGSYSTTAPNPSSLGPPWTDGDMAVSGSTMVMAGYDSVSGDLRYAQGTSQVPSTGNWNTQHLVAGTGNTGREPSIIVVNGLPKIAYYDVTTESVRLAQATISNPTQASHWTTQVVENLSEPLLQGHGPSPQLSWSNSGLLLIYNSFGDFFRVYTSMYGSNPLFPAATDWLNLGSPFNEIEGEVDDEFVGTLIGDRVYMAYASFQPFGGDGKTHFATYRPSTESAWTRYIVDPTGPSSSLRTVAMAISPTGIPWIAYSSTSTDSLRVARATATVPVNASQWLTHTAVQNFGNVRVRDMVFNDGRPYVAIWGQDPDPARRAAVYQGAYGGEFVYMVQAFSTTPTSRYHWTCVPVGSGAPRELALTNYNSEATTVLTFPATGLDRVAVLYNQPAGSWQHYAASYVPNPPQIF